MQKHFITWDLGATKCTAGLIEYHSATHALSCKKHVSIKLTEAESLEELIHQLEQGLNFAFSAADAICIGAAGYYDGEMLLHENHYPYAMPFAAIAKRQMWPNFAIIHDYASIICATFTSYMEQDKNIKHLNTSPMQKHGRRVALGVGTGLGLKDGVLFHNGDFWFGQNEAGHIGIPYPPNADQDRLKRHQELMRFLHDNSSSPALTFEKILTGKGTLNLYRFFHPDDNATTPEQVGMKMREGKAPEVLDTFAWYLGLFVGTVQLTFMPEGGVWITGGVSLNHLDAFDRSDFFAGIHASPAYMSQRQEYPLGVLRNHEHALIGCGYYAARRLL